MPSEVNDQQYRPIIAEETTSASGGPACVRVWRDGKRNVNWQHARGGPRDVLHATYCGYSLFSKGAFPNGVETFAQCAVVPIPPGYDTIGVVVHGRLAAASNPAADTVLRFYSDARPYQGTFSGAVQSASITIAGTTGTYFPNAIPAALTIVRAVQPSPPKATFLTMTVETEDHGVAHNGTELTKVEMWLMPPANRSY